MGKGHDFSKKQYVKGWDIRTNTIPPINDEFFDSFVESKVRGNKDYVTVEGMVALAHEKGLKGINTDIVQLPTKENAMTTVVKATVKGVAYDKYNDEVVDAEFTGIGDCSPTSAPNKHIAVHAIRMAECVPLRAQILTKSGWKRYNELTIGELVLAYNTYDDCNEWVELQEVSEFESQALYKYTFGDSFSTTCTINHKLAVLDVNDEVRLRPANELRLGDKVIISSQSSSGNYSMGEGGACLVGMCLVNGEVIFKKDKKSLCYFNELNPAASYKVKQTIERCTEEKKFNGQTRYVFNERFCESIFNNGQISSMNDLKNIIPELDFESRNSMLYGMICASSSNSNPIKNNKDVRDIFEMLCTLEGKTILHGDYNLDRLDILRNFSEISTDKTTVEFLGFDDVWCPTTKHGTWVMKLDDTITITGNTRAVGRALRNYLNMGMVCEEEMGSIVDQPDMTKEQSKQLLTLKDTKIFDKTELANYLSDVIGRPKIGKTPKEGEAQVVIDWLSIKPDKPVEDKKVDTKTKE